MLSTNPDERLFHQETDTFKITVALSGNRLRITLKDFVDWIIYSKEYTEEDYCKEIHKKMDLLEVYTAFSQTKHQCDEENMKEKQNDSIELKQYEFGSIVENEKLPCYKIEREGKITAYQNIMEMKTKKLVTYESNLTLTKVRNMTEYEISAQRSKQDVFDKSHQEIKRYKKEKQELFRRVINLQEENRRLKEETIDLRNELKITKQELISRMRELEIKTTQEVESAKRYICSKYDQRVQIQNHQQAQKLLQVKQAERLTQCSLDKFPELLPLLKPIKAYQLFKNLQQPYANFFNVQGFKVRYTGTDGIFTHFLFNQPIGHNQKAKFKIKIIHQRSKSIAIGVVDHAKQKDKRQSFQSGNAMCYYGCNGHKWPQNTNEGDGFKHGDIVEIDVNRQTSTVKYSVNGTLKATHSNNMLADSTRVFIPFVDIYNTNDTVEWLMD